MLKKVSLVGIIVIALFAMATAGMAFRVGKPLGMYPYSEWHPKNKISLEIWGGVLPVPNQEAWNRLMLEWEEKYPKIKIKYEAIPWEMYDTKIKVSIASGTGPDLVFEADREAEFPRDGVTRPIPEEIMSREYMREHNLIPVIWKDKVVHVYNIVMACVLYYNVDMLKETGISEIGKTWEESTQTFQKLTKWDSKGTMTQAGYAFNEYALFLWCDYIYQLGGKFYKSPEETVINSSESIRAWQQLVDYFDKHKVNTRGFLNFNEAFGTKRAAVVPAWIWFSGYLQTNYPRINWGTSIFPTPDGKGPYARLDFDGAGYMPTTLPEGDKLKAAWEFWKFTNYNYDWIQDRAQPEFVVISTPRPDYEQIFRELEGVDPAKLTFQEKSLQALALVSKQYQGGMIYPGEVSVPFWKTWQKIEEAILLKHEDIKGTLDKYKKLYDQLLRDTDFYITREGVSPNVTTTWWKYEKK